MAALSANDSLPDVSDRLKAIPRDNSNSVLTDPYHFLLNLLQPKIWLKFSVYKIENKYIK